MSELAGDDRVSQTRRSALQLASQLALIVPVLGLAWFFGGTQAAHQRWFFVGLFAALGLFLFSSFSNRVQTAPVASAMVPLLLALLLGGFQLVSLPAAVFGLAPENHALWTSLLPAEEDPTAATERTFASELALSPSPSGRTISLYPGSTRHDLALLTAGVSAFFLASRTFSGAPALLGLFTVVALNGAALSFFGIVQQLQWNGLLFGSVPLTEGGAPFASFVNRNSGAGFLNICLGAAIGLTVWAFSRGQFAPSAATSRLPDQHSSLPPGKGLAGGGGVLRLISELNFTKLAALSVTVLVFAGVVCSLSRGAWISLLIAAAITSLAAAFLHRSWKRVSLFVVVGLLGFGLVAWVGRVDLVEQRLATLWQNSRPDSRLAHWQNGWAAAQHFPLMGSGLGTYRYIYKLYEQRGSESWFYHAENQYLEALVEAGSLGLMLMLATLTLVAIACWRLLSLPSNSVAYAAGIGGLFVLASQCVHAGFDFGLYMPANMALLAILTGALSGAAVRLSRQRRNSQPRTRIQTLCGLPRLHALPVCLAALLAGAVWLGGQEIHDGAEVESALQSSRFEPRPDGVSAAELDQSLDRLAVAAATQPGNSEALERMGQLWVLRYRLQILPELQQRFPDAEPTTLWGLTSPVNLHLRVHELLRNDRRAELSSLRQSEQARSLINASRAFVAARRACPLLVRSHLLLAEIGPAVSESGLDQPSLARSLRLSVGDHELQVECGLLLAQAGDLEAASAAWRRSIELIPERYSQVLSLAAAHIPSEQTIDLIPASPELMVQAAREHFVGPDQVDHRHALAQRASRLVDEARELPSEQRSYLQGVALTLWDRPSAAVEHYRKAVEARPERTVWRYEFARLLEMTGNVEEAERQAVLCAKMEPANETYAEYHRELVRKRVEG